MVKNLGNTFQTAKPFPISETRRTIKASLTSQDQIDIWKISPKVRSSLNVTLNGISKKANADIDLLDAGGRLIEFSNLRGNKADTLTKPLEAGTFYLRVKLQRRSSDTRYALTVSATPSTDLFGNSFETATQLTSATGTGKDFVGNSDPNDFLKFGALVAGQFNFKLTGLSGDANLELYDNSRNLIAASNSVGTLNEALNQHLTNIAGSTYYLRIAQASGQASGNANYSYSYSFVSDPLTATSSGLQYIDLATGTGAMPQTGQTVTVNYTGILLNGTKFDSSRDRNLPFSFPIGEGRVIKGWDEGLSTMKVGGRRQLIIPANLAYGSSGNSVIPANSTLIFDVEVIGISG